MHRAYLPIENFPLNSSVTLTDKEEIHHIKNVLRLKPGEQVQVFNGKGEEAVGVLSAIADKTVTITVQKTLLKVSRSMRLILACAIPKNVKFDFIVEKATELCVDEIIPLLTERTEVKLDEKRSESKHARYETISLNAAKQAKLAVIPKIHPPQPFAKALHNITPQTLALIPYLGADERLTLTDVFSQAKGKTSIVFFIGPEGDFSEKEIKLALNAGCLPVTLGSTTLKVDTASLCVLSAARIFFHL